MNNIPDICSFYIEHPHPPGGGAIIPVIPRGRGFLVAKIFIGRNETKLEFLDRLRAVSLLLENPRGKSS